MGCTFQDLVDPAVVTLGPDSFQQLVKQRKPTETWMVDFYAPWCGPCQALLPEWRRMARVPDLNKRAADITKSTHPC